MSKSEFYIRIISKKECGEVLNKFHYLKDISKGFKSGVNYGLIKNGEVVGVCIYSGFPTPELSVGLYGLQRSDQKGLFELSRLCLNPAVQNSEHNLASWFVSRTIRDLKRNHSPRAILSYADEDFHSGTVYKACGFKYYGLSASKKDFWIRTVGGDFVKHSRGKVKGIDGEWRPRSRKHRFLMTICKSIKPVIKEESTK